MAVLAGCGFDSERKVDKALADQVPPPALIVDLDESPVVAVGLSVPSNGRPAELRSIALPFGTEASANRPDVMTAWGSRDGVTLVTYVATPSSGATSLVSLKPVFETSTDPDFTKTELPGAMYYMTSGLKRRFFYQGPTSFQLSSRAWTNVATIASSSVDKILVKLPAAAEVFEAPSRSRVAIASTETTNGKVRIFANPAGDASGAGPVDIVYQVPPTSAQQQVADFALKFFVSLLTPLAGYILIAADKARNRKLRLLAIGGTASVEVLSLAALIWWGIHTRNVAGFAIFGDLLIAVVGVVGIVLTARIKGEA